MKNNYRRLKAVLNLLDMNLFYSINICGYDITLQGDSTPKLVNLIVKNKFNHTSIDDHGYFIFNRSNIRIVLT